MRAMLKTVGKYAGYVVLTLVLFFYFVFLTFPYPALKDRYLPQWNQRLPCRISVREIQPTPLLWLLSKHVVAN